MNRQNQNQGGQSSNYKTVKCRHFEQRKFIFQKMID